MAQQKIRPRAASRPPQTESGPPSPASALTPETIANLIRRVRAAHAITVPGGMPREKLTQVSSVPYWRIVALEHGIAVPRAEELERLGVALKCPELVALAKALPARKRGRDA